MNFYIVLDRVHLIAQLMELLNLLYHIYLMVELVLHRPG